MKLKIICCCALFIIITGARDTSSKKNHAWPASSDNIISIPAKTATAVNGTATGTASIWAASFGGNAGN